MRLISVNWSAVSGPFSIALAFCSVWLTERKPGIGAVRGLRAQIQADAPWASVRPSLAGISRTGVGGRPR
jgi:hypothetical protein